MTTLFPDTLRRGLGAALLATAVLYATPALTAETLTFSSWLPPTRPVTVNAIKPWAEQVREAANGNVRVRVLTKPLGSRLVHFDLAEDGVADIVYGLQSDIKGDRFHLSYVALGVTHRTPEPGAAAARDDELAARTRL